MTSRDKAKFVADEWASAAKTLTHYQLINGIEVAIHAAVEEFRERAAQVAEEHMSTLPEQAANKWDLACHAIAAAIRKLEVK